MSKWFFTICSDYSFSCNDVFEVAALKKSIKKSINKSINRLTAEILSASLPWSPAENLKNCSIFSSQPGFLYASSFLTQFLSRASKKQTQIHNKRFGLVRFLLYGWSN